MRNIESFASIGLLGSGLTATLFGLDTTPIWSVLSTVATILGTLFTVWLALRKMFKAPIDQLRAVQDKSVEDRLNDNKSSIIAHSFQLRQLEQERVADKIALTEKLNTEATKLKDLYHVEQKALQDKLSNMQSTVSKIDERTVATTQALKEVSQRLSEVNTQLSTVVVKALDK